MFGCVDVLVACTAVGRELGVFFFFFVCVIVYVFCTVPWEESGLFLCDSVCVVYSAVEREWGVFV